MAAVYWSLRSNSARKDILLIASYVFYGLWDWRFIILLGSSSLFNYWIGLKIGSMPDHVARKNLAILSAATNLAILGFFKYALFFLLMLGDLFDFPQPSFLHSIILPIGISFFTFHSLSYTIDVYRRDYPPCRSLRDYLLFVSFFPQLVAGPIMRPTWLLPQFESVRYFPWGRLRYLLLVFALGFFKKSIVADNVAPYVDRLFAHPDIFSTSAVWTGVSLYAVQIYCDFSGYTDMALGVAGLLGYRLVRNFNMPYLARSIQDFWRRWHISLSSWLRDYLYIGLGGSRRGESKTHRNLVVTMLLGGLWHGAAWTFVSWGGLHGFAQSGQRLWSRTAVSRRFHAMNRARVLFSWALTLYFVCGCWIIFRAPSFETGLHVARPYLMLGALGDATLPRPLMAVLPALIICELIYARAGSASAAGRPGRLPTWVFALGYGALWALMLSLLPLANRPFIYFQF